MELNNPIPKWERIVFWGIAGGVVFAPLAFGAVHVWAYSALEILVFTLVLIHAAGRLALNRTEEVGWVKTPANRFLLLFLCIILIQILPMPALLSALLSPQTYADKQAATSIFTVSNLTVPTEGSGWFHLGYYKHQTLIEGLKVVTYILLFFLVINTIRSKRRINTMIWVLVLVGIFQSAYGIFQVTSGGPAKIWWWTRISGHPNAVSGTLIGSNHFAFFMEMIFFVTLGFAIAQRRRHRRLVPGLSGAQSGVRRLVAWFDPESANPMVVFLLCSLLLMGAGLLLSRSRGGILGLFTGLAVMGLLFSTRKGFRVAGVMVWLSMLLIGVIGVQISGDSILKKFARTEGLRQRMAVTASILPMLADYPLTGVGWGNFRDIFPRYQIPEYEKVTSGNGHAHNDWMEAGAETGVVGLGILIFGYLFFLWRMVQVWRQRRDFHAIGIGAGVIAALVSVGFHGFFDFSIHTPANGVALAVIAGIGFIALHRTGHGYGESFFYGLRKINCGIKGRVAMGGALLLLVLIPIDFIGRHFLAELHCPTEYNQTLRLNWNPYPPKIQKAIERNPLNAAYHFRMADYYMKAPVEVKSVKAEFNERAIVHLETALGLNPARAGYWSRLGERYVLKSQEKGEPFSRWLPAADRCIDLAVENMPNNSGTLINAGNYWAWRSTLLPERPDEEPTGLSKQEAVHRFQDYFRRALVLRPGYWRWVVEKVWDYYPDDATIFSVIPPGSEKLKSVALQWMAEKLS